MVTVIVMHSANPIAHGVAALALVEVVGQIGRNVGGVRTPDQPMRA